MPDLLDRRLDTLLVEPRTAPAWTRTQQKIARRRRARRAAGAGLAAAVLLVVVGAVVTTGGDQATRVQTGPASPPEEPPFEPGWTRLPDPAPVTGPAEYPVLIAAGGELFAWAGSATGQDEDRPLSSGLVFDPETTAWRPLDDPMAGGLGQPGAVAVGDEVLFVGTGSQTERWSPTTGTTEPFELPSGCDAAPVVADEDDWYFTCGRGDRSGNTTLRSFDPTTGSWEDLGRVASDIAYPMASAADASGRVYLAGLTLTDESGATDGGFAAYDGEEGRWLELPPSSSSASTPLTLVANEDQVVASAGDEVAVFDVAAGSWAEPTAVPALALPSETPERFGCLVAAGHIVDGRIVVVGCEGIAVLEDDGSWRSEPLPESSVIVSAAVDDEVLYVAGPEGQVWAFVP